MSLATRIGEISVPIPDVDLPSLHLKLPPLPWYSLRGPFAGCNEVFPKAFPCQPAVPAPPGAARGAVGFLDCRWTCRHIMGTLRLEKTSSIIWPNHPPTTVTH